MRTSRALTIVGVLTGVVAIVGYLNVPRDVGDADRVAASLTTIAVDPTTTTTDPSTTTAGVATTQPTPRWSANDSSLLSEVATSETPTPTRLVIDVLEIDAPIGPYGVDGTGQMEVPDNVSEVGWYQYGPSPGEPGSAVLAAHVDLRGAGRGLFHDLEEVVVGDMVSVGYEDGSTSEFEVVARATYLKSELPLDAIFSRSGDPVLTLVTCGGGFSQSTRSYDSNVVVYAVPVDAGQPETRSP